MSIVVSTGTSPLPKSVFGSFNPSIHAMPVAGSEASANMVETSDTLALAPGQMATRVPGNAATI